MTEGEAVKAIDDALSGLDPEAQVRVLNWANHKFLGLAAYTAPGNIAQVGDAPSKPAETVKQSVGKKPTLSGGKKPKVVLKQDKTLVLSPNGKVSASEFTKQKNPTNAKQKCVVAIFYIRDILEYDAVSIDQVYTFFKGVGWPVPANLANTLHQAGSEAWLDTAEAENLKITPLGENLVEHDLPAAQAAR